MGMLEIRRSSARLDSLGGFRMPELDNGSARAFAAQAEAASRAAAAAGVAGRAKVEGIARRGQIVARTLGDLGRLAIDLANRENERIATNAVLMSENDRNLYMTGDGTPENPGQFNVRQGKDGEWHAEEWLDDIKKAAAARRERFTKGLNGPQKRMYDEMVAKHDVAWNARIFAHAARTTMDAEIATATAALGTAKDAAIANFDVPVARERSIQEMYAAKEREMDVRQVPKGLRAKEMKALTEEFLVNFAKAKFTAWEVETAENVNLRADPEAVTKEWEEKGKALEGLKGTVIASEAVKKHLGGDTLDKVRQDLLAKEFNAHRAAAISRAYAAQREEERQQLQGIELKSREAIASGDLAHIETAFNDMDTMAKGLGANEKTKGSRVHVAAMEEVNRLDKAADSLAKFELMNDLVNGEKMTKEDGKTPIYMGVPRKERLFPAVYAAFSDQKRKEFNKNFRAAREQNLLVANAAMMDFAARGNPQGFYGFLADAVVNKKLTPGDFERLRDRFNDGWMKGFKGAPDQMSKQSKMAKDMLDAIKDKLGVDMSTAIKTNDFGDPAIRNGALDWDEKAELPDASVRREFKKTVRHGDMFFSFGSDTATRKEKIESQQLKEALNEAMKLWSSDGLKIEHDPVTGERLPEGKTHTVNAVEDFKALLGRLADERNILSAADTLKQQSAYAANVRLFAAAEANRRTERMTNSKPVTDGQIEEKNDKGE